MKAELTRAGFKNSQNEKDKTVAKKLGLSVRTIYKWKSELGQTTQDHKQPHNEQKELMKRYYEIKDTNPKINGKSNLTHSNCTQFLSMDILWKRMPRQMYRKLLKFGELNE
uniref:Uncharacterized protein n=1 Tax=Globodera rostochiensis TaxID=31243 RepID=A0A914H104_GLORO